MVLAQRSGGGGLFDQARPVLLLIGAAIVVVLIGGVAVLKLRERMRAGEEGDAGGEASVLESLHSMRRSDRITEEEYQAMRARVSRKVAAQMGVGLPRAEEPSAGNTRKISGPAQGSGDVAQAPPGYDLTGERLPDQSTPE